MLCMYVRVCAHVAVFACAYVHAGPAHCSGAEVPRGRLSALLMDEQRQTREKKDVDDEGGRTWRSGR